MCVGVVDGAHAGVATDGAELWLIGTCVCVGVVDGAHAGVATDDAELWLIGACVCVSVQLTGHMQVRLQMEQNCR